MADGRSHSVGSCCVAQAVHASANTAMHAVGAANGGHAPTGLALTAADEDGLDWYSLPSHLGQQWSAEQITDAG